MAIKQAIEEVTKEAISEALGKSHIKLLVAYKRTCRGTEAMKEVLITWLLITTANEQPWLDDLTTNSNSESMTQEYCDKPRR